jgi:hypothetical protein
MTKIELKKILTEHGKWLRGEGGHRANLQEANLQWANLQWANLQGAYLQGAYLQEANLQRADLRGAYLPSPPELLLCYWGEVSNKLCTELMKYDASNHPDPTKFDEWAEGKGCPYGKGFSRSALFQEKRELWKPGKAKPARELVLMLFKEKEIKFDEEI